MGGLKNGNTFGYTSSAGSSNICDISLFLKVPIVPKVLEPLTKIPILGNLALLTTKRALHALTLLLKTEKEKYPYAMYFTIKRHIKRNIEQY